MIDFVQLEQFGNVGSAALLPTIGRGRWRRTPPEWASCVGKASRGPAVFDNGRTKQLKLPVRLRRASSHRPLCAGGG